MELGLTGGYDYDLLKENIMKDETLKTEYTYTMREYELCVLEILSEPKNNKIKRLSREYWRHMFLRGRQ